MTTRTCAKMARYGERGPWHRKKKMLPKNKMLPQYKKFADAATSQFQACLFELKPKYQELIGPAHHFQCYHTKAIPESVGPGAQIALSDLPSDMSGWYCTEIPLLSPDAPDDKVLSCDKLFF